jgi:mono/diheme cytochrome c family protein
MMLRRLLVLIGVVGLAMGSLSGFASADHLEIEVGSPERATIGEEIEISATVRDAETGDPVEGALVIFYGDAAFIGVGGELELGRVLSNEIGVATYMTDFTVNRVHTVWAVAADDPDAEPGSASIDIDIGAQLVSTGPVVELPAVGGWIVRLVLGGVWAVMIVAALWIVRVSRSGRTTVADGGEISKAELHGPLRGGVNWAVIVATLMMGFGAGILVLLIRSPNTRANINPEGYNRSAVAYLDASYFYPGVGLSPGSLTGGEVEDGRVLFVSNGCAGCHGLNAQGTAAARSPAFATRQWLGTVVRSGLPGGMPSFDEGDIAEQELDAIYAFLQDARATLAGETDQSPDTDTEPLPTTTPEVASAPTTTTPPSTAPPTTAPGGGDALSFASDVAPIFEANCTQCHGTLGGWSATDYESVMSSGDTGPAVVPGDAAASILAQKVTGTQTSGAAMPPGGGLSDEDIATIVDWIAAGAGP